MSFHCRKRPSEWCDDLLNELAVSHGEGTFEKTIRAYQRIDLLILDEFLLSPVSSEQARELLEIIEARSVKGSVIFCTQFEPAGWYTRIGGECDATLSEAIIDRIVHNSYEVSIEGRISMRERHGIKASQKGELHDWLLCFLQWAPMPEMERLRDHPSGTGRSGWTWDFLSQRLIKTLHYLRKSMLCFSGKGCSDFPKSMHYSNGILNPYEKAVTYQFLPELLSVKVPSFGLQDSLVL